MTVSGDADALDEVAARLAAQEKNKGVSIFHRRLVVDTAYHSHHMRSVADDYAARLGHVTSGLMTTEGAPVAFISSVTGAIKTADFDAAYWTANLVSPVRFSDAVQELVRTRLAASPDNKHVVFVEVGPHPALAGQFVRASQAWGWRHPRSHLNTHPRSSARPILS